MAEADSKFEYMRVVSEDRDKQEATVKIWSYPALLSAFMKYNIKKQKQLLKGKSLPRETEFPFVEGKIEKYKLSLFEFPESDPDSIILCAIIKYKPEVRIEKRYIHRCCVCGKKCLLTFPPTTDKYGIPVSYTCPKCFKKRRKK